MESVKVRIQTKPGWSKTLREGFPRIKGEEGWNGCVITFCFTVYLKLRRIYCIPHGSLEAKFYDFIVKVLAYNEVFD